MDQRQEKASEELGQAVTEVVQSGLFGTAEVTQARGYVNGELTNYMVVIFAQTPEVLVAVKERVTTATLHERTAPMPTEVIGGGGSQDSEGMNG